MKLPYCLTLALSLLTARAADPLQPPIPQTPSPAILTPEIARHYLEQNNIIPQAPPPQDFWDFRHTYDSVMRDAVRDPDGNRGDIMVQLLAAGIDINKTDNCGNSYLHDAVWHYNDKTTTNTSPFEILLALPGIDINIINNEGHTPLSLAVTRGHQWCVYTLLARKDICRDHWSPLFLAILENNPNKLREILASAGASPNEKARWNNLSALHVAALLGRTECLRLLLATDGILLTTDTNQATPLHAAARKGHSDCLRLLLAHPQADINAQDACGNTALSLACYRGNSACARLLLEQKGLHVNSRDTFGNTPLMWAAADGDTEIVRMLLQYPNIQVNTQNEDGWTALMYAALGNHADTLRVLLQHPDTDSSLRTNDGANAISFAVSPQNTDALRILCVLPGIDLHAGHFKSTPLHEAVRRGLPESARVLLQAGADVNARGYKGTTPLFDAIRCRQTECTRLLLLCPDIDVNATDDDGNFALWCAAKSGDAHWVQLLLQHPLINPNQSYQGQTPLQTAIQHRHADCIKLLQETNK